MNNKRKNRFLKFICIVLASCIAFCLVDFGLSELTDTVAYEDAVADDVSWNKVMEKAKSGEMLNDEDYQIILSQSGLGKPAFDRLFSRGRIADIEEYREYFLQDKDYYCYRKGVFACHEVITDAEGEKIKNPPLADLQNGDIIITLSIHSLGWRHGHAAIVTDAEKGQCVQAVMVGYESDHTYVSSWNDYPLVAILRLRDADAEERNQVAEFAEENLMGLNYSLFTGIVTGRNPDKTPSSTQCAHLVWYAYYHFGIDISPKAGRIITPMDFMKSEKLEIVQVYGNILEV